MAKVIKFYIPAAYKPRLKWVSEKRRGQLIAFPCLWNNEWLADEAYLIARSGVINAH